MNDLLVIDQTIGMLTITSQEGVVEITAPAAASLVITSVGIQGPPGPGGGVAKTAAVTVLAGQIVRPNNTGQLVLAQADMVNDAKGARVAATSALANFNAQLAVGFLSLFDWTAATGSSALSVQSDYFLSPTIPGSLTTTIPTSPGQVLLHIGTAIDTTTLALSGSDPITL